MENIKGEYSLRKGMRLLEQALTFYLIRVSQAPSQHCLTEGTMHSTTGHPASSDSPKPWNSLESFNSSPSQCCIQSEDSTDLPDSSYRLVE